MRYEIKIPNFRFPSLNQFETQHWSKRHKLKREGKDMIMAYGIHVPKAYGKRKVEQHITLSGRQKKRDYDNEGWKVLMDSLVANLLLIDDSADYVESGAITYERGKETKTIIALTDV